MGKDYLDRALRRFISIGKTKEEALSLLKRITLIRLKGVEDNEKLCEEFIEDLEIIGKMSEEEK